MQLCNEIPDADVTEIVQIYPAGFVKTPYRSFIFRILRAWKRSVDILILLL